MNSDFNLVPKLGDVVINQIKNFNSYALTKVQVIPNENLKERYKSLGLCIECNQPNTGNYWCHNCNSKHFQKGFNEWTSGNKEIDQFIQKIQLNSTGNYDVLEWIPHDRIKNIEFLAEGGFGLVYKALWIDGHILYWDVEDKKWQRKPNMEIVLKYLKDAQNLTNDFLQEVNNSFFF